MIQPLSATLRFVAVCAPLALGCSKPSQPRANCAPCTDGFVRDAPRALEISRAWAPVAAERALDLSCLCFGDGASTVVDGGNVYLPASWDLAEQTARAAHLALHRQTPPWSDEGACEVRVQRALEREVDGHVLELDTRRRLGVTRSRYPFEPQYFAVPAAERRVWLRDYFLRQPQGDGVVPGFVLQYRARCGS